MVERLRVTHVCLSIPLLRQLKQAGNDYVKKYDRRSLRVIETGGDVLPLSLWEWCYKVVGESRCKVVCKWGQTECLGALLNEYSPDTVKSGQPIIFDAVVPFFGVELAIIKEKVASAEEESFHFEEVSQSCASTVGRLCFKGPVPGFCSGAIGPEAHSDYIKSHFKRFPGDMACLDGDGNCKILGREVDVINCHGERILGRVDIEGALVSDSEVELAAVVGYPTVGAGEGIFAYVVRSDGGKTINEATLRASLKSRVSNKVGVFAVPDVIVFVKELPWSHTHKLVHWALRVISTFFGVRLAEKQRSEVEDQSTFTEPPLLSYATYTPGSLTTALAPVIGAKDASSLEQQLSLLLSSDITLANPDSLHMILEKLRVYCT